MSTPLEEAGVLACPTCGGPMQAGGFALACGRGSSVRIPLPAYCPSADCRKARDEAAIARAIEQGLIDP